MSLKETSRIQNILGESEDICILREHQRRGRLFDPSSNLELDLTQGATRFELDKSFLKKGLGKRLY